ncbi:metallophosphoesterase [Stutzerimonas nitrititolerans]|uniref:metallophosphoesterase n=1 Tax=Stutzerimonas nitrititolerans TaxID=2482751 RepID=UPI0028A89299|nr:metallophosphoesterase [Stutzerimonas nitrititolerans]
MPELIKRFAKNTAGRDFAVGDIHGCFTKLQQALDGIGFDPAVDRLFSVGDLVDRGPECQMALEWLAKPWFQPVRGNHDDYVCRYDSCELGNWLINGGGWFLSLNSDEQAEYAVQFRELPIAIELETDAGLVGIVHADCPTPTWAQMVAELTEPESPKRLKLVKNSCMWSRTRIEMVDTGGIPDLLALVAGHTPLREVAVLGNVAHIDTVGWRDEGYFTLMDLSTLPAVIEAAGVKVKE